MHSSMYRTHEKNYQQCHHWLEKSNILENKTSGKLCHVSLPLKGHEKVMLLCLPACELEGEFGEKVG